MEPVGALRNNNNADPQNRLKSLITFPQWSGLVAIAAAIPICFGFVYCRYYFHRLSFPYQFIDVSTSFFVIRSLMPITIALSYMVQYVGFLLPDTWLVRLAGIAGESLPPRVTKVICREFAIFSAILVTRIAAVVVTVTLGSKLLAYSGYEYLDEPTNGLAQVFFVAAVVLSVSPGLEIQKLEIRCALLRITPAAKFRRMKPMLRLLAVACALSLVTSSILTAVNIGRLEAEKLIEGTSRNSLEITFKLKGNPVRTTQTYILVLIQGDNYYVVEQENPAPAKPLLHVFPRDEVVSATIEKMNP